MTPEQASTSSGIMKGTLLRYERGESEPGALKIVALAEAYGVSGCHLLGLETATDEILAGQIVLDVDAIDAINNAETEAQMAQHVLWNPPPFLVAVSIPLRQRNISGQEAMGIGAQLLERLQTIAPVTHRRWASQYLNGVAR